MYRNKYFRNFSKVPGQTPLVSYVPGKNDPQAELTSLGSGTLSTQWGSVRNVENDPRFDVQMHSPYMSEIITRATVFDYFRTSLLLPNPSEILRKLGRNIEEYDQLLNDARVKSCLNNRRAGSLSLKWTIDQNESPADVYEDVKAQFENFQIYDIMSELLLASFYGYAIAECGWKAVDGKIICDSLVGKASRWVAFDEENQLRYKTKIQMTQGEQLPPRKILVVRYNPTYQDPYSGREAIAGGVYWPVKFRHMTLQSAEIFIKRYAMPAIDVQVQGTVTTPERINELMAALKSGVDDNVFIHPETTVLQLLKTSDAATVDNYVKYIDMLNREIDMVILGNNMSAEIKGGSFAAAQSLAGVRDDIIQADSRMMENAFNTLIDWMCYYNYDAGIKRPKFRLYRHEPASKDKAEIDVMVAKLGVKFSKSYLCRVYGYNDNEIEIGIPQPELMPNIAAKDEQGIAGAIEMPEGKSGNAKAIQQAGDTNNDTASNKNTVDSIVDNQKRGSPF